MSAAESSVIEFEALAVGSAWASPLATSKALVAEWRAAADVVVFPPGAPPVTADLIAQYTHFTGRFGQLNYGALCSQLHGRAAIENPELAAMLRSPEALEDVGAAASRYASPITAGETHEAAQQRGAGVAIAKYKLSVSRHLTDVGGALGEAAATIVKCAELDLRLDAAKLRLELAADGEVGRVQDEHRAATEAKDVA